MHGYLACVALTLLLITSPASAQGKVAREKAKLSPFEDVVAPFDDAAARSALEPGTSVVTGRRYVKPRGGLTRKEFAKRENVWLLPMTAHMEEWVIRYKDWYMEGVKKLPPEVLQYAAVTQTNDHGRFRFLNLKAGRYMLLSTQNFTMENKVIPKIGETVVSTPGRGVIERHPIYGPTQHLRGDFLDTYVQVVEVKDGTVIDLGNIND